MTMAVNVGRIVRLRGSGPWLAMAVCLVAGLGCRACHGADDRIVDEPTAGQGVAEAQRQTMVDLAANFDGNLFEQHGDGFVIRGGRGLRISPTGGSGDQVPESPTRAAAMRLAEDRLARLDAVCGLTEPQRRRLRLAMESDIHRLVEEVDGVRRGYDGVTVNFGTPAGQRQWQQFQQDLQRCRQRLQGLFDRGSLFAGVLATTLDESQAATLDRERRDRRGFRWRMLVSAAMLRLDDVLGLDGGQHETIERMLVDLEPPLRTEGPAADRGDRVAEQMLVYLALSRADQQKLKGLVSERQWQVLQQLAAQGRQMRSYVEAQGMLEQD